MKSGPKLLPRHLQPPPDRASLDQNFSELPLLVPGPETEPWRIELDNSVSIFIPVHKTEGLGAQGTLIDGNMDSNIMRMMQAFIYSVCWSDPRRWNETKCMVAVLHRDSPDGVQDSSTQAGVLLYFQHPERVYKKKKQDEGESTEEDGPGEEAEHRTLAMQLDLNFEDFFEFLHDNPVQPAGAKPSAKRTKRGEDAFPERVIQSGAKLHAIPSKQDFMRLVFLLFPGVNKWQYMGYELNPHVCFTWETTQKYARNSPSLRDLPEESNCIQWLKTLTNDDLAGVSESIPGVDLYFPSKKFCTLEHLFSVHIPRVFGPPLNAEQIREIYSTLHQCNGEYFIPEEFSEEDVLYSAFRNTYGNQGQNGVRYPRALGPNDPAFFFRSISLDPSFDFIKTNQSQSPFSTPLPYQTALDSIYHLFRGACGPTSNSGMTHWLKAMNEHCGRLPDCKEMLLENRPLVEVFLQWMHTKSPAKYLSAFFALEGVFALIAIGSDSSEKKHMLLSGEAESGKTIMLDAISPFINMRTENPTPTVWGEWGQLKTQFVAQRMNEAPPEIQGDGYKAAESKDASIVRTRAGILDCMEDKERGRDRANVQDLGGASEIVSSGGMKPKMMLFLNANTTNFDTAFMSRLSHRIMWKPRRSDWARLKASINKNKNMDSPEISKMILLTRIAAWLPLLKETRHVPTPPQEIISSLDLILSSMKDNGCIVLVDSQRFIGRLQNDALNSHAALRAVAQAIKETEIPLDEIASCQWKRTVSEIITRAIPKWHVTLQDLVYAITFERDTIGNETILLMLSLVRKRLMHQLDLVEIDHNDRIWVEDETCNLKNAEALKSSLSEQFGIDILPNDLKILSEKLRRKKRKDKNGTFVVQKDRRIGVDVDLLRRAFTPLEQAIIEYFMENEFRASKKNQGKEKEGVMLMSLGTALKLHLDPAPVKTRTSVLFKRYNNWKKFGIKSAFSLESNIPEAFLDAGFLVFDAETVGAFPQENDLQKTIKEVMLGYPVEIPVSSVHPPTFATIYGAPQKDPYWRIFPEKHVVVTPGEILNSEKDIQEIITEGGVDFLLQDLVDYVKTKNVFCTQQTALAALKLLQKLNNLGDDLTISREDAVPLACGITTNGLQKIYDFYIGPLGLALRNIKNLTETPQHIVTLSRPKYDSKKPFRTIFYDPDVGQEKPSIINDAGHFVAYSPAENRQRAEAMII